MSRKGSPNSWKTGRTSQNNLPANNGGFYVSGLPLSPTAVHSEFPRNASFVIQVNSNAEKLRSKQTHRPRIPGAARQLIREPALAFPRIIV